MNALPTISSLDRAFPIGPRLTAFLTGAAQRESLKLRRAGRLHWALEAEREVEGLRGDYGRAGDGVRDAGSVRFRAGGVECRGCVVPPDDAEAGALFEELADCQARWPKPILARHTEDLPRHGLGPLFEFRTPAGDEIICVQERLDTAAGKYRTWLPFSNGQWFVDEPSPLPLYGLEKLRKGRPIMIHEGAKAAEAVTRMLAESREHPWAEALGHYDHLGWIGGALRPLDTDWAPIAALSADREVVIVADNDAPGTEAVKRISERLGRRLSVLRFDERFPTTFDLADDWPGRTDWWRGKRYCGPRLDDLRHPATWATRELPSTGERGRPGYVVRDQFAAEWLWALEPPVFVHRDHPDRLLSTEVFNRLVRPYSHAEDTARLLSKCLEPQVEGIAYRPGESARVITDNGRRMVNTFRPGRIRPEAGDPGPWLEFLEHLVPGADDRRLLMRWIATLVARPKIRMRYSVLMISSAQGVGKTTLGEAILAPLVGYWNTSFPSEHAVLESQFNDWLAHKRLIVVGEIYSGASRKAYDKLKGVVTDSVVSVNRKFQAPYEVENHAHIVACSNSIAALHLDDEDRRWLVPKVTEELKPAEWWRSFYGWLNSGGLGIIATWAETFVEDPDNVVGTGERAPMTSLKSEIVLASLSDGQRMALELAERVAGDEAKVVLIVDDVRELVRNRRGLGSNDKFLEKAHTLRKQLVAGGLREPTRSGDARIPVTGRGNQYVVANFDIAPGEGWDQLKQWYRSPETLVAW